MDMASARASGSQAEPPSPVNDNNKRTATDILDISIMGRRSANKLKKSESGQAVPIVVAHDIDNDVAVREELELAAQGGSGDSAQQTPQSGRSTPKVTMKSLQKDIRQEIRELTRDIDSKFDSIKQSNIDMQIKFDALLTDLIENLNKAVSEKISAVVKEEMNKMRKGFEQQIQAINQRVTSIEDDQENVKQELQS